MNDKATDTRPAFFMVEDIVIEKFGLTPYEGWVYVTILKYANRKTGEAFPGIATIAKVTQMSKSQVMRSIATLEKKCLIRVVRDDKPFEGEKRKREVNHYFILSASSSVSQEVGVVSDRKYPSVSQEVGVVSDGHLNQYSSEPELINNNATPQPKQDTIAIYIKAWLDGQMDKPANASMQYSLKGNRAIAKAISEAGFTPQQVTDYTKAQASTSFWSGKLVPLKNVGDNIAASIKKSQPQQWSDIPELRGVTEIIR